ncbi:MAG: DNA-formamidopyrimidine glycosylase family protein [Bacteroidota bacterium]
MPELPDLLYIQKYLRSAIIGRTIRNVAIKQPIVLRVAIEGSAAAILLNKRIDDLELRGPFIRFGLSDSVDIVMNLMLMGKLQHQRPKERPEGYLCLSLILDDDSVLNICDEQKMAKVYVVRSGDYSGIPKYSTQGVPIFSSEFTLESFAALAKKHSRKQVRVFINDHTIMSSIGNAYADEILFDARIHPKTFTAKLLSDEIMQLYSSIRSVMEWGIKNVESAEQPIHVKVREHMKVRWRKGEPCPRCGTTIRREGVRGHDVFFCPTCQPASRKLFIDWRKT